MRFTFCSDHVLCLLTLDRRRSQGSDELSDLKGQVEKLMHESRIWKRNKKSRLRK